MKKIVSLHLKKVWIWLRKTEKMLNKHLYSKVGKEEINKILIDMTSDECAIHYKRLKEQRRLYITEWAKMAKEARSKCTRMILDNLGIIVDTEKANQDYAKAMGIVGRQLTDTEKKQAFLNATLEAGDKCQ